MLLEVAGRGDQRRARPPGRARSSPRSAEAGDAAIAHEVRNPRRHPFRCAGGVAETMPAADDDGRRACSFIPGGDRPFECNVISSLLAFARPSARRRVRWRSDSSSMRRRCRRAKSFREGPPRQPPRGGRLTGRARRSRSAEPGAARPARQRGRRDGAGRRGLSGAPRRGAIELAVAEPRDRACPWSFSRPHLELFYDKRAAAPVSASRSPGRSSGPRRPHRCRRSAAARRALSRSARRSTRRRGDRRVRRASWWSTTSRMADVA